MTLSLTMTGSSVPQTQWYDDLVSKIIPETQASGYQILHAIPGRLRIGLSRLADDRTYTQLQAQLQSLSFVTQVRINPIARSIVIHYTGDVNQDRAMEQSILAPIQALDPQILPTIALETSEQEMTNFADWLANELKTLLRGIPKGYKGVLPTIGTISLILGILGFILPLVPGFPFLILASICFSLAAENES